MSVIGVTGVVLVAGGSIVADTAGWTSPTGLAAFIAALIGLGTFGFSVFQFFHRRQQIDLDAAVELIRAAREGADDAEK